MWKTIAVSSPYSYNQRLDRREDRDKAKALALRDFNENERCTYIMDDNTRCKQNQSGTEGLCPTHNKTGPTCKATSSRSGEACRNIQLPDSDYCSAHTTNNNKSCQGQTLKGQPCQARPTWPSNFCSKHSSD